MRTHKVFYFSGGSIHWESLCIVEGILRFLQDVWYILAVFVLIFGDSELGEFCPLEDICEIPVPK